MINKVALKKFFEQNKEDYYSRRNSGDIKKYDEDYKWEILPKLNSELSKIEICSENSEKIAKLLSKNLNNFSHWIDMDDLQGLSKHKNFYQIFRDIKNSNPETIVKTIEGVDISTNFLSSKKFAPSTLGYILTAFDCKNFSLYREEIAKEISKICLIEFPKNKGKKYKLVNDASNFIGNLVNEDGVFVDKNVNLLGQDFIWTEIMYNKNHTN
jgi:hypothetical protein